ncbi:maltose o-acetyltransferas-like protein, partial [Halenospora varia]
MASTAKDKAIIELVKFSETPVPWCDEFEKMISGMNFRSANSQVMLDHKFEIRRLCKLFSDEPILADSSYQSLEVHRLSIIRKIIGRLGGETNIECSFFCTWGCNTFIGKTCYINRSVQIFDSAPVIIGDRVLIGPGVGIYTDTHEVDFTARQASERGSFAKPVKISDDCWIGAQVVILPGVTIGSGCTISAGAVVAKDIE